MSYRESRQMTFLPGYDAERKGVLVRHSTKSVFSRNQDEAAKIIVSASGNVLQTVCKNQKDNLFSMIEFLDTRFAPARVFSLFAVLSSLFGKRHIGK